MAAGTTTGMISRRRNVEPASRCTTLSGIPGPSRKISIIGLIRKTTGSTVIVPMMKRLRRSARNSLRDHGEDASGVQSHRAAASGSSSISSR